jgi:predicted nucleic acid-binding protein
MRCIYADPDNLNKFNKSDSGLLAQIYLQLSKSGTVVTGNVRHFERIPALQVENWLV